VNGLISPFIEPHRGKPAILDTNLLLLYLCDQFDQSLVSSFKRLNCFVKEDISLLSETVKCFSTLHTTPHVLTEVSNLANSLPKWQKQEWGEFFGKQIKLVAEEWIPAVDIASVPVFDLGITDACLYSLASKYVILTIDFPLSNQLSSRGLNVINFNNLRGIKYL